MADRRWGRPRGRWCVRTEELDEDEGKDAILVGGDFNCSLRNPEFAEETTVRGLLKEGWVSVTEGIPWPEAATVRPDPAGKYPAADFDHILLSPGWGKNARRDRWKGCVNVNVNVNEKPFKVEAVQNKKMPSDHWPVVVRF